MLPDGINLNLIADFSSLNVFIEKPLVNTIYVWITRSKSIALSFETFTLTTALSYPRLIGHILTELGRKLEKHLDECSIQSTVMI